MAYTYTAYDLELYDPEDLTPKERAMLKAAVRDFNSWINRSATELRKLTRKYEKVGADDTTFWDAIIWRILDKARRWE